MAGKATKILLVNSACGKYPRGQDPWVKATVKAIGSLASRNVRLISSLGLSNWDLTTYLAGKHGISLELIVPGSQLTVSEGDRLCSGFRLDREKTHLVFTGDGPRKSLFSTRDRLAFEMAEVLYPVSVRPKGRLAGLIGEFGSSPVEIREDFRIEWSNVGWRPRYDFRDKALSPDIQRLGTGWLFHWTHSTPGRWPDEEPWRFYRDMLALSEEYVRDARATLLRIAREGVLRGSESRMPGREKAVSLTALPPADAVPLMRWRKRYLRYSLEPFGLAFSSRVLEKLGARPVHYFSQSEAPRNDSDRLFYQSAGRAGDWTLEKEWRLRGDLSLDHFSRDDLILFAADPEQALTLSEKLESPWRIMPLFKESVC